MQQSLVADYSSSSEDEEAGVAVVPLKKKRKLISPSFANEEEEEEERVVDNIGSWPSFLYIEVPELDLFSEIIQEATASSPKSAPSSTNSVWARINERGTGGLRREGGVHHLSLSKNLQLKVFQISKLKSLIEREIESFQAFKLVLSGISLFENEDRSKSFLAVDVKYGVDQLKELVSKINIILKDFSTLEEYYQDPKFHVSLLCRSNLEDINKESSSLDLERLKASYLDKSVALNVQKIIFVAGKEKWELRLMKIMPPPILKQGVAFRQSHNKSFNESAEPSPIGNSGSAGVSNNSADKSDRYVVVEVKKSDEDSPGRDSSDKKNASFSNEDVATEEQAPTLTAYLAFKTPDLESEFSSYFVNLNLLRWRKTISAMFIILSTLYVYLIAKNTVDWVTWSTYYSQAAKATNGNTTYNTHSVSGWYLLTCDPNIICGTYNPVWDASFWFTTILIPYVLALVSCYHSKTQTFAETIDKVTSLMALIQILIGVGIRFFVIEYQQNFLQPTIIMIIMIIGCFMGSRARFIYALGTIATILFVWVIINIVSIAVNTGIPQNSGGSYGIGLLSIVFSSIMVLNGSYETEHFYRIQFLQSKEMRKNNAKLKNQLNLLAKSYNQQAVKSLDSPLERSMMVIRSVMADPSLISRHLLALGQVTSLLASSNLLTPDFEGTVAETMDNEQQAWLFSEIAARRRKGRGKSNYRRRLSIQDTSQKAGSATIKESAGEEEGGDGSKSSALPHEPVDRSALAINTASQDADRRSSKIASDPRSVYPPELEEISHILSQYNEYDFNLFELSSAKLFELFVIPMDKFSNCISAIEGGYHADLPYHNSVHATDVLHCIHNLAHSSKVKDIWSDIELLAMYFAAIIHDHDHPGLSNNFLVTTSDPKATFYNDKAVLENHHCASSFLVLAKPENNFLGHLTKAEFKSIREVVVDLVLATDLTQHFTLLSMFKSKVASPETYDPFESRDDRMLLYKIMIKCSDVSNPTKDLSLCLPWTRLITAEFFSQGDLEKKLGLPVSPYCDRENPNAPSSQIGFIDYVVQPLFGALDTYQPIPHILSHLAKNREYWGNLKLQGVTSIDDPRVHTPDSKEHKNNAID